MYLALTLTLKDLSNTQSTANTNALLQNNTTSWQ